MSQVAAHASPVPAQVADASDPLMRQFDQPLPRKFVSPLYQLALAVVAVMMLLLPLIYVALVVGVAYGVFLHATGQIIDFSQVKNAKALAFLYVAPLAVGVLLVLFMVKPLFAPRGKGSVDIALRREDQRRLFEFVARLCRMIGAPEPKEIRVNCEPNASASFRHGMWSFVVPGDLRLTIGLPLVVGMDLRQFTGVLAHEFGHFSQGFGMRVSYTIRTISHWFARVVYERDAWDERIAAWTQESPHYGITIVLALAQLFIWLSRRVLWVLMWVGHIISSFMSRQMEFDADRYETRVAGSKTFARTSNDLPLLGAVNHKTLNDAQAGWEERRLCDDLMVLFRSNLGVVPAELKQKIVEHASAAKTGWFDSHPSNTDRIRASAKLATDGVFTDESPATVLFENFDGVCKLASMAFYQDALGERFDRRCLVPASRFCAAQDESNKKLEGLGRYLQIDVPLASPLFVNADLRPSDDLDGAAEVILAAREKLRASIARSKQVRESLDKADAQLVKVKLFQTLKAAGVQKFDAKALGLDGVSPTQVPVVQTAAKQDKQDAITELAEMHEVVRFRLEAALEIAMSSKLAPQLAGQGVDPSRVPELLAALGALKFAHGSIMTLRDDAMSLAVLLRSLQERDNPEQLVKKVLDLASICVSRLTELRQDLARKRYPFEHSQANASIGGFLAERVPPSQEVGAVYQVTDTAVDRAATLYYRVLGELTHIAEQVETALGMPAMEEPKPDAQTAATA